MSKQLPSVSSPSIILTLPMSQKKIKYRPFVNKEKKALLLSKESDDWESTTETLRDVILSCTGGDVDIKKIPVCDAGYLFIQLRIQSIGDTVEVQTKCQSKECEEPIQLNYKLGDIKVETDQWEPTLMITESVGVTFKPAMFEDLKYASGPEKNPEFFVVSLIESIFDDDEVYDLSEYTQQDLVEWLDQLTDVQMRKINDHLEKLPTLKQDIKYKCPKCNFAHEIKLEGLSDFF